MRAAGAVLTALIVYLLQALLVIIAASAVGYVGVRADAAAPWVFIAYFLVATAIASGAGGYAAIRVTHALFPRVQPLVVQVGVSTLFVVYVLVLTILWIFGAARPFEGALIAVGFYVNVAVSLPFMRLAVQLSTPSGAVWSV